MLTLTLNGKIIEQRFVRPEHIRMEGYLEGLQKDMEEKYEDIIDLSRQKPKFYLEPGPAVKKNPLPQQPPRPGQLPAGCHGLAGFY